MKNRFVSVIALLCCASLTATQCTPVKMQTSVSAKEDRTFNATAGAIAALDVNFDDALGRMDSEGNESINDESAGNTDTAVEMAETSFDGEDRAEAGEETGDVYGYHNIGLANVRTSLNVREGASKNSRRIGKMEPDSACEILDYEGDWAHIKSGDVTGYVMSSYLFTGDEAVSRANSIMSEDVVTVNADVLRVREAASTDSRILTRVTDGTHLNVVDESDELTQEPTEEISGLENVDDSGDSDVSYAGTRVSDVIEKRGKTDGWIEVDLGDGCIGYVSTNYVITSKALTTAISTVPQNSDIGCDTADVIVSSEMTTDPGSIDNDSDDFSSADLMADGGEQGSGQDPGGGLSSQDDQTIASAPEVNSEGGENGEDLSESGKGEAYEPDESNKSDDIESHEVKDDDGDGGSIDDIESREVKIDDSDSESDSDSDSDDSESIESREVKNKKDLDETSSDDSEKNTDDRNNGQSGKDEKTKDMQSAEGEKTEDMQSAEGEKTEDTQSAEGESVPDSAESTSSELASYAMQFLGNPYCWGGSSLTNGADCSGFVMTIFSQYGVSLPHSSAAQSSYGQQVPASEARPGDLFFYGSPRVSHVGIYVGNGQIIHASNKRNGIKLSSAYYQNPVRVTRLIQ